MNADQAKFLAEHYAAIIESEIPTTAKVLAAVGRGDGDYKPDPKSRSAIQLARHIATADGWFVQSVLDGKFEFDQAAADKAEASLSTAADAVAFYEQSMRDKVNQLREEGVAKRDAICQGAESRLRPIAMTTLCTLFGFAPLAFFGGDGAEVRAPMAITVIGGLAVSTLLTLVVIPIMYDRLDRKSDASYKARGDAARAAAAKSAGQGGTGDAHA